MTSVIKRLADDAAEPFERLGTQLLRRGASLIVGIACLVVSLVFLTAALNNFLQNVVGPEIATLCVGGIYLCAAILLFIFAAIGLQESSVSNQENPHPLPITSKVEQPPSQPQGESEFTRQIDGIIAPVLNVLRDAGLERERAMLVAGSAITKELTPLTGVVFAVVAGFLLGRGLRTRP
jgi:hypothetical protein